ncbi:metacaspase-1 [uncultured Gammaproteobacteria bacterium]
MIRRLLLAGLCLFSVLPVAHAATDQGAAIVGGITGQRHALIIGINDYPLPQHRLRGAVTDARNMERLLIDSFHYQPDQIKLLIDRDATRDAILTAWKTWLIAGTKPGDEVFFYFSGHGSQVPDLDGDEPDGLDETLVPADVGDDGQGGWANMIIDDEIDKLLAQLTDRHVTIVVDSCHSGTITRGMGVGVGNEDGRKDFPPVAGHPSPQPISTRAVDAGRKGSSFVEARPNLVVWSAVAPDQVALEENKANPISGVFTTRFIRGVRDKAADANGDGVVSVAELHDYLQRESEAYCQSRLSCRAGLTPTLEATRDLLPRPATATGGVAPPRPAPQQVAAAPQTVQQEATALLTSTNPDNVTLEILPAITSRIGQPVRFRITSASEGYLLVLDVNAANQLTQIFPNQFAQRQNHDNRIAANRPLTIPDATYGFEFTASEPTGEGLLIALVIRDPLQLSDLLGSQGALDPVARPDDYLTKLAERLHKPWTGDATTRRLHWSMTSQRYTITR